MAHQNEEEAGVNDKEEEEEEEKSLSVTDISTTPTASDSNSSSYSNDVVSSPSEEIQVQSPIISTASSVLGSLRSLAWLSWPSQDFQHQLESTETPTSQAGNLLSKFQGPPAKGASLDRFLMANWAIYTN